MDENVPAVCFKGAAHGIVDAVGEAHEKSGCNDSGDDGNKDITQSLNGTLERICLCHGRFFCSVF